MKLTHKGFTLIEGLLVVIALCLVIGVGFYVVDANKDEKLVDTVASNNQKGATTDKQTYTNDEAGFTLEYPSDWQFNAKGSKDKSGEGEFGGNQFVSKANYEAGNNANILMLDTHTTNKTAEQFANEYYSNKEAEVVSSTSSTINGYPTQTVNFKSPFGNPSGYDVFVVKNGKVAQITYYDSDGEEYTSVYKAIIKSIKFN